MLDTGDMWRGHQRAVDQKEIDALKERIDVLERQLKEANYWRERNLADCDCYALRDERRFQYLQKMADLGAISHEIWVTYTSIHGVPDVKAK